MKPVQYIVANKGLGMSPGKLAAQVAHAAVNAYRLHVDECSLALSAEWLMTGHTKIVLEARDTEHLLMVERYLDERGIKTCLIIDEGRTEIAPHTPTALATVIVDKDDPNVQLAFSDLRTYRAPRPELGAPTGRIRNGLRNALTRSR
jgi:peptidyl-tRNA hydrolase, PTH2 family